MKLIKKGEGQPYEAEGHFGVWSMRKLVAGKDSQRLIIGLSHFLPKGGVKMAPASPSERTYFILSARRYALHWPWRRTGNSNPRSRAMYGSA